MRNLRSVICTLLLAFLAGTMLAAPPSAIQEVSILPAFFNPTAGQSATIRFRAAMEGTARVTILDRDRFPVRTLAPVKVARGPVQVTWDGRDDRGAIVPDEAWSLRIELGGDVYDPAHHHVPVMEDPQPRTYSRVDGVLAYRLARPSRVHIQAGQARANPKGARSEGPILRTIVDRQPRVAGSVIERWNGFDESGTIGVASLPNFVVSVLATSLPDNTIITRGNRRQRFLEYARKHRPAAALAVRKLPASSHQHSGLNAFEDCSPRLRLIPSWTGDGGLRLEVHVEGPGRAHFLGQPGHLSVYLDEERVISRPKPASPAVLTIPAGRLGQGPRRIAVNWGAGLGPVAVGSLLIDPGARVRSSPGAARATEVGR